ncbi:MAG: DUF924 domain-containing protein [Rhodospirillaceae bacterium]|nr:DUF924 domain-containing protein [Rhodospirillaceae bacterium]MBT5945389.1 DUF924 domain-containing protein [Rhodospirillaceae bacterium]MBT6405810.1 DUF924 domain-containing protein [Rhodospirillaceae bacterium]MBT6535072.1 DUF924 domain-containing protein [Rhodospirillaceae bacterium]MBT7360840.1 DUF924 domain-containing protein [Rhodospirillaceae bacterium]
MCVTAAKVLDFWFNETDRQNWFERSDAFDQVICDRFAEAVETARGGGFADWHDTAQGCLAVIILIDQLSRNIYRESPLAWSADDVALSCTRQALVRKYDTGLGLDERKFLYMPLMHSEVLADQEQCVELFRTLAAEGAEDGDLSLEFAIRHRDIIARFGRFPHRNETLGRESAPEEIKFLEEPNSSF